MLLKKTKALATINNNTYLCHPVFITNKEEIMRTNRIMDEIRSTISPEMKLQMEMSVSIANRIYEILEAKGMTQKDLASLLGKKEAEISKWMRGTHIFTIDTLVSIEKALGAPILQVVH